MAIVRDCGDFEAKLGFGVGINFTPPISREKMAEIQAKFEKLQDDLKARRERMELELLDWMCDQLGYTEAVVKQLVETRFSEEQQAIVAEKDGRAKKHERRNKARV